MDWSNLPQSLTPVSEEADRRASSARVFFARENGGVDEPGLLTENQFGLQVEKRRLGGRRFSVIFVSAFSAIAVLAVGFVTRSAKNTVPIAAHLKVPTASRSAAAVNALPPPNLLKPLSPGQAAVENAERPFVNRPDSGAKSFVLRTDAADRDRALTCLAQAVYYEAAGEGIDGERAVAQVVLNRLRHPGYPSTICGVVYEGGDRLTGCQFSFVCDGSMQRVPVPWLWTRSRQIAEEALKGRVFAQVGHATHYHADYVSPFWADSLDKSVQVGRHIFYRLRSTFGEERAFSQRYRGNEQPVRIPGATVVLPPMPSTAQLATTLINDGVEGSAKELVEKASSKPSSPLLVDSSKGMLLADGDGAPAALHPRKSASQCSTSSSRKVAAIGANDMRSSADINPTC